MKTENLRICKIVLINYVTKEEKTTFYYFHGWSNSSNIRLHPEDPAKDLVYSYKVGVVENIETGVVSTEAPSSIIFITD